MAIREIQLPVICVRCRKTVGKMTLTIDGDSESSVVYTVCEGCRTGARLSLRYGRLGTISIDRLRMIASILRVEVFFSFPITHQCGISGWNARRIAASALFRVSQQRTTDWLKGESTAQECLHGAENCG